jgi:hypothetical protein
VGSRSSSVHLPHAGFQEPQELLQSWEKKACGQHELWCLLVGVDYHELWPLLQAQGLKSVGSRALRPACRCGLPGATTSGTCTVEASVWQAGTLDSACCVCGLLEGSTVALQAKGTKHLGKVSLRNCFLAWVMRSISSCCRYGQSKPVGSQNLRCELPDAIVQAPQQVI